MNHKVSGDGRPTINTVTDDNIIVKFLLSLTISLVFITGFSKIF